MTAADGAGRVDTLRLGDLEVRRLGFGAMQLTGEGVWGLPDDPAEAIAVLRRCLDLGVNLIDTADTYGPEVSEELIAEALHPYPADLVIATKGGTTRTGPGHGWPPEGRPEHLKRACEGSLRRLRVETIDVYQLHTPDPKVPFEESLGALRELREEGKIRHAGISNVDLTQLQIAQRELGIVSVQNRFNLVEREGENVLAACESEGLAFIPWYPLKAGNLTSPGGPLASIAAAHAATPAQVAIAWLLHRSPAMLPIPGTGSVAHLEENVRAEALKLDAGEVEQLNATDADRSPVGYE